MKKITVIAVFLFVIASATWVMAGPQGKGKRGGDGWCVKPSALATLNLSAEQSEKVRGLRESFLKEVTPIRTQMFTKKAELRLLWIQTNLDPAKIRATQKEIRDLRGQMQEKRTDFRLAFRNLLSPEQTTRLLAEGVCRGMGSKWGKARGGGPGSGRSGGPGRDWRN